MNKTEVVSLLKLLEDPDDSVFQIVKAKILDNSELFRIYLENFQTISGDLKALSRSEQLLNEIHLEIVLKELRLYVFSKERSLLKGALIIESYFNPDVDLIELESNFENIFKKIWLELNDQLTGLEKVKVINHILFDLSRLQKFAIGEYDSENLSLSSMLSSNKFIPPTIALLYCIIAQKAKIPLYPMDIPKIFLLGYVDDVLADTVFDEQNNGVVFHIYPFDNGDVVSHQSIENFFAEQKLDLNVADLPLRTYLEFLIYWFEMRVLASMKRNENNFASKNAKLVMEVFNSRFSNK